ncbi:protein FAR1-RELATED SEQUENCE 5-like [Asparagus officinalis]|uniref:protein FAR1-RELATED SEQUENCE 5-like n=1 Tax=Asparagus officinalis TaxID=4686 RepID=UPI00098E3384|nr:protein FAR1-RELATED SEQUENCE 5-like [Asparagus officinalis]
MMRVKVLEDKSWEVTGFVEEHTNHVLSSPDKAKMHRSHQQFHKSQSCKRLIESLQEEGMPPSTISRVINATTGREGELVTPQQCIDHIRYQRVNNIGHECISIIKHFQSMTANDPEFYFAIEVDSNGQMRSVFWADERSRASYLQLSDVVVFDVIYRTNKFSLPFAPFTGAIITDQDRAMCNAIHSVFPLTRHRYCFWHMQKHITDHLPTLCEGYWLEMKENFDINEEGDGWLQTVYKYREHWVSCYLKDTFFAGMRSSQRSESINAFFDGLSCSLDMFDVFQTEFKGFGTEFCEELRKDGDIVEYKICKFADRGKWEVVTYKQSSKMQFICTCALFETNGVVCRHILSLMMAMQISSLPDHYILHRWTIHARHQHWGVGNIVFGRNLTSCEEKINLLKSWALRAKFNNALELAFDSEERMQKLDNVLTKFIESLEEEVRETEDNPQISASVSHTMEHIPQNTVRDPEKSVRTKGRPHNATRIQSGLEQAQEKRERKKRICSRCGELGHYRISCKVNLPSCSNFKLALTNFKYSICFHLLLSCVMINLKIRPVRAIIDICKLGRLQAGYEVHFVC